MKSPKDRIRKIIQRLKKEYPDSRVRLNHRSPFELLISTILAAQCTDKMVNKITPALFNKYKNPKAFSKAKLPELQKYIRSTGFYRNKAKNIIATSKKIIENFAGKVPDTMEDLITLPGVARKTANIVLSVSFNKAEGIAVDTHVKRLSGRLGLTKENDPNKIERDLLKIVPHKDWIDFNFLFVDHGRAICDAKKPLCKKCVLGNLCPSAKKFI